MLVMGVVGDKARPYIQCRGGNPYVIGRHRHSVLTQMVDKYPITPGDIPCHILLAHTGSLQKHAQSRLILRLPGTTLETCVQFTEHNNRNHQQFHLLKKQLKPAVARQ